jgi:class 3 adenylate cyclase
MNVAARLESLAEPGTVYVGRSTHERTRAVFTYDEIGPRSLRGRAAPVNMFRLEPPRSR